MAESPSAASLAALYNGRSVELVAAYSDGEMGMLRTLQFEETRGDKGEVELLLGLDWGRKAPVGAAIVVPEAGQTLAKIDGYWLMWRREDVLCGQSVHQAAALSSPMAAEERMIDRPLVTGKQELHAYGWRGGKLVRHRFAVKASVEAVMDRGTEPARSACAPLPGDEDGTALIGMVDEVDGGIAATAMYVRGAKVLEVSGRAEGRYRLMGRQRMGLHVGKKSRPALAVMTESVEGGAYSLLEARFDFGKQECVWKRTRMEMVGPGSLESAAVYYYKTLDSPEPFVLAVDNGGKLIAPRRRTVQVVREGVGGDYGYPILTTAANRYEAMGVGSEIKFLKR